MKPGDLCEFVPSHSGGGFMYELPIREIRNGKVCRPIIDWSKSGGYCAVELGTILVLLVQKAYEAGDCWAVLYGETLVEVSELELVLINGNLL